MSKMVRIIRTYTTVTDVDLTSYFDFAPAGTTPQGMGVAKRQWTVEEVIAYERGRASYDQDEAFQVALANGEGVDSRVSFDVIEVVSESADRRTDIEREADEQAAAARRKMPMAGLPGGGTQNLYEENAQAGLLGT